jgi:hypothetical protein
MDTAIGISLGEMADLDSFAVCMCAGGIFVVEELWDKAKPSSGTNERGRHACASG